MEFLESWCEGTGGGGEGVRGPNSGGGEGEGERIKKARRLLISPRMARSTFAPACSVCKFLHT